MKAGEGDGGGGGGRSGRGVGVGGVDGGGLFFCGDGPVTSTGFLIS